MEPWLAGSLWGGAAVVAAVGAAFARGQNRAKRLGGAISRAKQVWLTWAVYTWFVLAPLFGLAGGLRPVTRGVLLAFAASMWLRGVVELVMLFVTKNWRPPYGIAHDVFTAGLLAVGLGLMAPQAPVPFAGADGWGLSLVLVLWVSMGLETYYALAFHRAVEGRTTGDDGIWFATAHEARFRRVNRVTAWANAPLCGFVAALLVWAAGVS